MGAQCQCPDRTALRFRVFDVEDSDAVVVRRAEHAIPSTDGRALTCVVVRVDQRLRCRDCSAELRTSRFSMPVVVDADEITGDGRLRGSAMLH